MNPQVAFVVFVTLLWGPTVLWLVYRALRGGQGRLIEPFTDGFEPVPASRLAPDELEAVVGSEGFWVCGTCSSLNRREVTRCYGCRAARGPAVRQPPGELPAGPGVPVMAESVAQPSRELLVDRGVAVMAEPVAQPSRDVPVGPRVPVMAWPVSQREVPVGSAVPDTAEDSTGGRASGELPAGRRGRGAAESSDPLSGEAVRTTAAGATPTKAPPTPGIARAPGHPSSAAPPEASAGVTVCPFLGLRDDPSTRFDFPDGANVCHATSTRGAPPVATPRRFLAGVAGTRRPEPITMRHQESHCLAAAHEQCARYLAVEVLAANR